jgi:hypothetical protein
VPITSAAGLAPLEHFVPDVQFPRFSPVARAEQFIGAL